jgi:hypothetical protein
LRALNKKRMQGSKSQGFFTGGFEGGEMDEGFGLEGEIEKPMELDRTADMDEELRISRRTRECFFSSNRSRMMIGFI